MDRSTDDAAGGAPGSLSSSSADREREPYDPYDPYDRRYDQSHRPPPQQYQRAAQFEPFHRHTQQHQQHQQYQQQPHGHQFQAYQRPPPNMASGPWNPAQHSARFPPTRPPPHHSQQQNWPLPAPRSRRDDFDATDSFDHALAHSRNHPSRSQNSLNDATWSSTSPRPPRPVLELRSERHVPPDLISPRSDTFYYNSRAPPRPCPSPSPSVPDYHMPHRSRTESPSPSPSPARPPPRSVFPGLSSHPFIPEEYEAHFSRQETRKFPLFSRPQEHSAPATPVKHTFNASVDEKHAPARTGSPAMVENFSRPRKASVRSQQSDGALSRRMATPRLHEPIVDGSEPSPQVPTILNTPPDAVPNDDFPPRRIPGASHPPDNVNTSTPQFPNTDFLNPAPNNTFPRQANPSIAGPYARQPTSHQYNAYVPHAKDVPPWVSSDEARSSFRSQLTVSTAQGTGFTSEEAKRNSILTKASSFEEQSILNDYARRSWRMSYVDDGPSLEDVMGMYERGFTDSDAEENIRRSRRFPDDDFLVDSDNEPDLPDREGSRPVSRSSDVSDVRDKVLEAMDETLSIPGALTIPNSPEREANRQSVRLSRTRHSLLAKSLPNDVGLGLASEAMKRRDKVESVSDKHDSAKLLDGDDDLATLRDEGAKSPRPASPTSVSKRDQEHSISEQPRPDTRQSERPRSVSPLSADSDLEQPQALTTQPQSQEDQPEQQQHSEQQQPMQQPEEPQSTQSEQPSLTPSLLSPSSPAPAPELPPVVAEEPEDPDSRDRYGFRKANANITRQEYDAWNAQYTEYLARRRKKWVAFLKENSLMTDHPNRFPPRSTKTKRFIRKGIPPDWRGAAWFYYAGGPAILSKHRGVYDELVQKSGLDPQKPGYLPGRTPGVKPVIVEDIEKDLYRTFPDNIKFKPPRPPPPADGSPPPPAPEPPIITSLRRVLHAFALYNPRIGYCQSLNFLAGLLLLFVETEEHAFWLLNIITRVYLPGTHEMSLEGSKVDLGVLMTALKETMPAVWKQLGGDEFDNGGRKGKSKKGHRRGDTSGSISDPNRLPAITLCMTAWFMSCFIGTLPIETVLRVWDVFFYEGSRTLFRIALTIFKLGEREIRAVQDPMEMFGVVQNFPRRMLDCNQLMDACYKRRNGFGHISQQTVEERRQERRDGIRRWKAQQEAMAAAAARGDTPTQRPSTKQRLGATLGLDIGSSGDKDDPNRSKSKLFGRRKQDQEQARAAEVM